MAKYGTAEEVIKRINSNKDWYNKSYAGYLFGINEQAIAIAHAAKNPIALPYGFAFYNITKLNHWDWFWDNEEIKKKRASIIKKAVENSKFAEDFLSSWDKEFEKFIEIYNERIGENLEKASNKELSNILKKIHEHYVANGGFGYIVDSFLTSDKEDWLVAKIKEELKEKATSEVIAKLTQPTFGSFVNEYEAGLIRIAKMISEKKASKIIEHECNKLAELFIWIKANYNDKMSLTAQEVKLEARKILEKKIDFDREIEEKIEGAEHNRKNKLELYKKLKVSHDLQNIIGISEVFTHVQDKRKERVLKTNFIHFKIFDEIAKRFKRSQNECYYLNVEEAISLLDGKKVDWKQIERRSKEEFMEIYFNGQSKTLYKEEIAEKIKKENMFHDNSEVKELRGAVAYRGNVRGKVQVLRNSGDIELFKEGNILVANQTTPEFVPAMKKAAAIVTDQGGITCHAAIVSRELKRPCVIGTKIATRILKDGDEIEVDADKGIVRIIKKA